MKKEFKYNDLFDADIANAKFAENRRKINIIDLFNIYRNSIYMNLFRIISKYETFR